MTGDALASTPEQVILSSASPVELASTLQRMEVEVLAEALFRLTPAAGAHVFAALPTEAALRVLTQAMRRPGVPEQSPLEGRA